MDWSGAQLDALHQAVLSAYPRRPDLKRLLRTELEIRLPQVVADGSDSDVVFALLEYLEAQNRLLEFVEAAHRKNSTNTTLKAFVEGLVPDQVTQGPAFEWLGPADDKAFEGLFQARRTATYGVDFLQRMAQPARAVCRIELPDEEAIGTGFLVAKDLLLTNYHVIAPEKDSDPHAWLDQMTLRFGYLKGLPAGSTTEGPEGQAFRLAANPLLKFQTVEQGLDYALLRIEPRVLSVAELQPVVLGQRSLPDRDMNIHILQHPEGQALQVTFSNNGITGVYENRGWLQYVSDTALGSSGSPCFNDNWELVGVHHAQVPATFGGVKGEGILFRSIYEEIAPFLTES